MSKRKSEEQIIALLKRAEAGEPIADLCRQEGIGVSTFYKWRSKYDGLEASELKRLKQIEQEHERLITTVNAWSMTVQLSKRCLN